MESKHIASRLKRATNCFMHYNLWIDNQASGPFDVCQITELFLNGAITGETQIRLDSAESWMTLDEMFPSIASLPTRSGVMRSLCAEIRSTKIPVSLDPQRVIVTDFDMSFGSMFMFMIKWCFAAIPAMIVISTIVGFVLFLFGLTIMNYSK